uniref:Uncharacterized protein n=1 Tax=Panagrolaimus davidi TaxID=227884 RepID=A0A914QZL7_9BILA
MFLFIGVILFCAPLFIAGAAPPPQSCNSINAVKYDDYFEESPERVINSFMNLKLFKFGNATWIHVGTVDYKSTDLQYPDYICANVPFDISVPDSQKCSTSLNTTFSFALQGPSFNLYAHFSNDSWSRIFTGYADDGTFSFIDGTFFNSSQPRLSTTFKNNTTTIYEEQTCTSFVSAPEAPKIS